MRFDSNVFVTITVDTELLPDLFRERAIVAQGVTQSAVERGKNDNKQ